MDNLNLLALACGCVCALAGSAGAAGYSPRVGEAHPDFVLPSIADGEPVSLSQFRGKKVLLVHFASW
ncbi:MAG: peroxiredoxin family protein [Planctomycetota bacterium]